MFALEYQVDRQVKKLSGKVMFYLLLFSSLNVRHNSLRTLEQFYSSPTFTGLFDKPIKHAKYNSIRDRLITINADYSATEIAELYKRRWEIEVFFKFIKQHLDFSHLLSRNENGMKVEMYMTLITAILLIVHKKESAPQIRCPGFGVQIKERSKFAVLCSSCTKI